MCWQRQARLDVPVWGERRQPPPASTLRVSDADRQIVVDDLQRHTADGRLTLDEFEERVDEALRARTGAELRLVTRDLPSSPPPRPTRSGLSVWPVVVICAVAVLLVTGAWWILIPAFFAFGGCGHRSAHVAHTRREERDDAVVTYV